MLAELTRCRHGLSDCHPSLSFRGGTRGLNMRQQNGQQHLLAQQPGKLSCSTVAGLKVIRSTGPGASLSAATPWIQASPLEAGGRPS